MNFKQVKILLLCLVFFPFGDAILSYNIEPNNIEFQTSTGKVFKSYKSDFYAEEYDYFAVPYLLNQFYARFQGLFSKPILFGLSYLKIYGNSTSTLRSGRQSIANRSTIYFQVSVEDKYSYATIRYGLMSMLTLGSRTRNNLLEPNSKQKQIYIDANYSQSFPSLAISFFESSLIGLEVDFLVKENNLVYGWLSVAARYNLTESNSLLIGFEGLNQSNFGRGVETIIQSPSSIFTKFKTKFNNFNLGLKLGLLIKASNLKNSTSINLFDRVYAELSTNFQY